MMDLTKMEMLRASGQGAGGDASVPLLEWPFVAAAAFSRASRTVKIGGMVRGKTVKMVRNGAKWCARDAT